MRHSGRRSRKKPSSNRGPTRQSFAGLTGAGFRITTNLYEVNVQTKPFHLHLTYTGSQAGRLLCTGTRTEDGRYVHATYANLTIKSQRNEYCRGCLKVFADWAFSSDDDMPDWVAEARATCVFKMSDHLGTHHYFRSESDASAFQIGYGGEQPLETTPRKLWRVTTKTDVEALVLAGESA